MTDPRAPTTDEDELLDFIDRNGKDVAPLGPPGVWHDFGEGVGDAAMQGLARTGRAAAVAGAVPAIAFDKFKGDTAAQDWYFDNVVDPTSDAVDAWTPNAAHVGAAGQALNGLTSALIPLAVGGGNPVPLLGTVALDTPVDLLDKGAPPGSAIGVAGIQTVATAAGFKLPAAWGSSLIARLATGAGGNLAIGAASRDLSARALDAGGSHDLADQYGGDATAAILDVGMGLAFGALAHAQAPKVTRAQRDAVLTTNNAHHFETETAPGTPADQASAAAHVSAIETAVRQLLDGEAVNLADAIPDAGLAFVPRVQPAGAAMGASREGVAPGAAGDAYDAFRVALESGGRADAAATTSRALGRDQFIPGTWRRVVAKARPAWAEGLTDKELLAARTDPVKSAEMERVLRAENAAALESAGLPADTINLYAAHHFGPSVAKKFARAGDDVPMEKILPAEQLAANAYLRGKTKAETVANWTRRARRAGVNVDGSLVDTNPAGQALRARLVADPEQLARDYAALPDSEGGRVLNTDTARELAPEYLADRTRSADVHEAASDTIKTLYETRLAEPTPEGFDRSVLFTAGGTGAGKTTAVRALDLEQPPEIVYDTNMNTLGSAVDKVEQALAAGRDVQILYVYRDPVDALANGALPRAERQAAEFGSGRTVPLTEHAKTHTGVRPVMEALAERYQDDPRVQIQAFDNSRGKEQGRMARLAEIPKVEEHGLHERLQAALDEAHQAGRISDATRSGFAQGEPRRSQGVQRPAVQGAGREPQPQRAGSDAGEVTPDSFAAAANDAVAEIPDLMIADADGNVRPASEFLQDIQATTEQAEVQARALDTAVNCFLRSGT
jgi:hypothetical protein